MQVDFDKHSHHRGGKEQFPTQNGYFQQLKQKHVSWDYIKIEINTPAHLKSSSRKQQQNRRAITQKTGLSESPD